MKRSFAFFTAATQLHRPTSDTSQRPSRQPPAASKSAKVVVSNRCQDQAATDGDCAGQTTLRRIYLHRPNSCAVTCATGSSFLLVLLLMQGNLSVYSKKRMVNEAFDACRYLGDHGLDTNLISFNTMLHVSQRSDQNNLSWKIFEYMFVRRIYPNQTTTEVMIDVMLKEGVLPKLVSVLDRNRGSRCAPSIIVNTTLAFRIIEEDRAEEAITLLKRMLQRNMMFDDIAYSLIVASYCKLCKLDSALQSKDEMISRGCNLNSYVYTCLIGFYSQEERIEEGVQMMEEMSSIGLKPYDETYNHLIIGLSRNGWTN
ncbi:hypothetical protein ZIOFF_019050 [Zingiber officinale]|uniref:Pentatricopeptide repeat-containing protein n=1 Tax=Zingiber officinale TaxID=94328 RepID=A0A8J5HXG4_ZINOF|nr:hypothetical protein ZIOFF_019050 [Zingiber officinale]